MESISKPFNRKRQFVSVLLKFFWRWLMTAALCGAIAGTIYGYFKRAFNPKHQINLVPVNGTLPSALNEKDKRIFSTLVTGLQIGLSVNVTAAIHDMTQALRWLLVSRVHLPAETFNLVMASDDTWNLVRLFFGRSTRWTLRLFAVVWIFVFLAAQIGTALIGLTFDVVYSDDVSLSQAIEIGKGQITNLSFIGPPYRMQTEALRRSYTSLVWTTYLASPASAAFLDAYRDPLTGQDIYSLNLTNLGQAQKDTIYDGQLVPSDRVLRANATCTELPIRPEDRGINSTTTVPFINFRSGTGMESLQFMFNTTNTTTFAQRRIPGPRSAELLVYWKQTAPNTTPQADDPVEEDVLYNCTNHIMQTAKWEKSVNGVPQFTSEEKLSRMMPDNIASLWAAASGWTVTNPLGIDQQNPYDNDALGFDVRPTAAEIAATLASASLNAIYFQDSADNSTRISEDDIKVPTDSFSVLPHWDKIGLNLGLIAGIHGLLAVAVALRLRRVLIVDSSPLNMAVLLRDAVRNVGPGGAMLSGKEVAALIDEPIAYGWRDDVDDDPKKGDDEDARRVLVGGEHEATHLRRFTNGEYY